MISNIQKFAIDNRTKIAHRIILLLPFLLVLVLTGLNFRFIWDEKHYSIKIIEDFVSSFPRINLKSYTSASGPVPYLIWALIGKYGSMNITVLRLSSTIASMITVNIFYSLVKRAGYKHPLYIALMLAFNPYFYFYSFTIYTHSITVLFGISALYAYFLRREKDGPPGFWGNLFASLAVNSRLFYMHLPGGLFLHTLIEDFHTIKVNIFSYIKDNFKKLAGIIVPVLSFLPFLVFWGGLTPVGSQEKYTLGIQPHINFLPIMVGFYYFPLLLSIDFKLMLKKWKILLPLVLILCLLYFSFPLVFQPEELFDFPPLTGITMHSMGLIADYLGFDISRAIQFLVWTAGVLVLLHNFVVIPLDGEERFFLSFLLMFFILQSMVPYIAERYYLSGIPYLVLILFRRVKKNILVFNALVLVLFSTAYAYWQIYLKVF